MIDATNPTVVKTVLIMFEGIDEIRDTGTSGHTLYP
jgi:hypothetical protein